MSSPGGLQGLIGLMQFIEQMKQRQTMQADANIGRLPQGGAGATVAQAGLTPKMQKAKFGRELAGTDLVAPLTAESEQTRLIVDKIRNGTPQDIDALSAALINRMQGTPGATTSEGLRAAAQAGEAAAKTSLITAGTEKQKAETGALTAKSTHQLVAEGIASLDAMDPATRKSLAQRTTFGTTEGDLAASDLDTRIKTESKKMGLEALADPSHPLNAVMQKNLGFNAITAAAGIGLGMNSLLDQTGQIVGQKSATSSAMDVAVFKAKMDQDTQLNQAEADWAKDVAKEMGGTVSPRAVLNWKRWREGGGDPAKLPQGVSKEMDSLLSSATGLAYKAKMVKAAEDGDPYAQQMMQLVQAASRITNNNTLEAVSELLRGYFGKVQANAQLGPRPTNPTDAAKWDAAANAISNKMPKLDAKWFFTGGGVQKEGGTPNVPAMAPASGTAQPNTINIGGRIVPVPPDTKPEDLANIQMLIQAFTGSNNGKPPINLNPIKP